MIWTVLLHLVFLSVLHCACHSTNILPSSRQKSECSSRDFLRISRPNHQSRSTCKRYQFLLFATTQHVCFAGTVALMARTETCDTSDISPLPHNRVVCSLGKYIPPSGGTKKTVLSNYLCNPDAPSYLFRVTHPGSTGTTDVVMKFESVGVPIPLPTRGPHESPHPTIAPVQPFAPSVVIRSTKNSRTRIIRAALRRVNEGGLAWRSLVSNAQVTFTIEKLKKFKYLVFFNFHETFGNELPVMGSTVSNSTVSLIQLIQ